jgi:3-isopropylmalate dehydrogenase
LVLHKKNNDSDCISAGKKLEDVVLDLIKSGITTKDIGGEKSTQEFTKEITNRL